MTAQFFSDTMIVASTAREWLYNDPSKPRKELETVLSHFKEMKHTKK